MALRRTVLPGFNCNRHLTADELENNIGGLPITDNRLHELFDSLDTEHKGYLTIEQVKEYYKGLPSYGLEPSEEEVEAAIRKYATGEDDIVTYEEFSCVALSVVQR